MVLITFTNDKPRFVKVMSYSECEFWEKVLHKVHRFFRNDKTRICEAQTLRNDFRMIRTTLIDVDLPTPDRPTLDEVQVLYM